MEKNKGEAKKEWRKGKGYVGDESCEEERRWDRKQEMKGEGKKQVTKGMGNGGRGENMRRRENMRQEIWEEIER
jgi:hypothetical protein